MQSKLRQTLIKWIDSLDVDSDERVELAVQPVLIELMISHFNHHFKLNDKSISQFLKIVKNRLCSSVIKDSYGLNAQA